MPNKTLYVKDADLPLFEQAQEQWGESVSSMFAEFLRERVAKMTPEENGILELINQLQRRREAVRQDGELPDFVDGEYAEAEGYAAKALKALRTGDIRKTKVFFYAANSYRERAERDVQESRALASKMAAMLGTETGAKKKRDKASKHS